MGMVQGTMAQKEAYAVLSEDKQTVTFYFDDQKADRNGVKEIIMLMQHMATLMAKLKMPYSMPRLQIIALPALHTGLWDAKV